MDYLVYFAGIGLVLFGAYFVANLVYRRVRKRSGKVAVVVYLITFLACIFLIGFVVLLIMIANGQR
jgi:hypothetical protein